MADRKHEIPGSPIAVPVSVGARYLTPANVEVHGAGTLPLEIAVGRAGRSADEGNVQGGGSEGESLAPGCEDPVIAAALGAVVLAAVSGPVLRACRGRDDLLRSVGHNVLSRSIVTAGDSKCPQRYEND